MLGLAARIKTASSLRPGLSARPPGIETVPPLDDGARLDKLFSYLRKQISLCVNCNEKNKMGGGGGELIQDGPDPFLSRGFFLRTETYTMSSHFVAPPQRFWSFFFIFAFRPFFFLA